MIELVPSLSTDSGARLVLRPRRAMSGRQFAGLFAALALAAWIVALASYSQGNVYAPVFALLDSAFVAWVLRRVWRSGERFEVIALDQRALEVRRSMLGEPAFRANPHWVRLTVAAERGQARVRLGSQGRQVEVGAFLSVEERLDLARRLGIFLATATGRGRDTETTLGQVG